MKMRENNFFIIFIVFKFINNIIFKEKCYSIGIEKKSEINICINAICYAIMVMQCNLFIQIIDCNIFRLRNYTFKNIELCCIKVTSHFPWVKYIRITL